MMRSVMSEWDKKKEKYSLVNVDDGVERTMRSVLGADVAIVGCGISTVTTTVSLGAFLPIFFFNFSLVYQCSPSLTWFDLVWLVFFYR